jgi:hypothetical protein
MTRLIGLAGFKRSGKNSVADIMSKHGWVSVALADALREEVHAKYGVAPCDDSRKEERMYCIHGAMRSYRELLIEHGQGMRSIDPDYWIKKLNARIAPLLHQGASIVITDVRMRNEIAWVRAMGGCLVWISRQGVQSNGHETEQDQRDFCDYEIENSGSIDDLEKCVYQFLETHSLRRAP